MGLKLALSLKYSQESMIILDSAKLDSYKTTNLSKKLSNLNVKSVLIVDNELDQNLINSAAGLINVNVLPIKGLNVYDILKHQILIISKDAIDTLEKRFAC